MRHSRNDALKMFEAEQVLILRRCVGFLGDGYFGGWRGENAWPVLPWGV